MANVIVRIFKAFGAPDISEQWVNTYEFTGYTGGMNVTDFQSMLLTSLMNAERALHLTNVFFIKATLSTYQPDSKPYNPNAFATIPLSVQGQRVGTGDPLDKDVVYFVRKTPESGHNGKFFYRGCLTEADVQTSSALNFRLTPNSSLAAGGEAFATYQGALASFLEVDSFAPQMAMIYTDGALSGVARNVVDVTPGGVTVVKSDHKHYNRLSSTQGA